MVLRHRALILLVVAAVGLGLALWLPTRQDSASATENSGGRHSAQDRRGHGHHGHHGRHRDASESAAEANSSAEAKSSARCESSAKAKSSAKSESSAKAKGSSEAASSSSRSESRSISVSVSSAGATARPPAGRSPSRSAARATKWAPFTHYVAGQSVTYNGVTYRVRETHTSLPGWEPPKIPSLFRAA